MKNSSTVGNESPNRLNWVTLCLHLLAAVLLILTPILLARAQTPDATTTISSVSSHSTQNGTVITVGADNTLNRAQTWQDRDGFHVVIPDAGVSDLVKSTNGIKVRRTGSSIEILLLTKPGTPVGVQNSDNHLTLTVEGRVDTTSSEPQPSASQETSQPQPNSYSLPTDYAASSGSSTSSSNPAETTKAAASTPLQPVASTDSQKQVRDAGEYQIKDEGNVVDPNPAEEGFFSSLFSATSVGIVVVLAVVALLVVRKFRSKSALPVKEDFEEIEEQTTVSRADSEVNEERHGAREPNTALVRNNHAAVGDSSRDRNPAVRQAVTPPASLYGAYRIDQEVGKLILGQAHRMDVLSSRASEDRRAIQASLIKTIVSADSSDDERRRAREALEEYGFVARESAALLLATDAFERTSAARSLGEIGSASALPFLLEALYDAESIVRNQAVVSIGELKVPSAIGALLDMARKHPDVPSSLVSRALSACSVEGLGFFDTIVPATSFLTSGNDPSSFDFTLEPPSSVEDLPESLDDEGLQDALEKVFNDNVEERTQAIKDLAQYPAKDAVNALVAVTRQDPEAMFRALAVTSLAFIDHESVFPAILIGMADDSREVRAAAARALSRLSFDRSEAYVTVIQTADEESLVNVARACIKAGIVSQNIDRLASGDRRQAYEAFCLISLLAKARMTESLVDAIEHHTDTTVRLSVVYLLANTGEEHLFEQLQKLALNDEMDEEVKTALLEGMYKLEQARPRKEVMVDEFVIRDSEEEINSPQKDREDSLDFEFIVGPQVDEVEL